VTVALPAPAAMRPLSGLQARFLMGAGAAAFVFALAAGVLGHRLGAQRAESAARGTIESLQSAVEKTAAVAVFAHDPTLMREIVEGVARTPFVRRVDITDAQGRVLLQSAGAVPGGAVPEGAPVQRRLVSPFDATETLGVLRIVLDEDQLRGAARDESARLAALMVGQALLITLVVYLTGLRLVSRPIVRLAQRLAEMPPGTTDLLATPPGHARDEIGGLVRSANELLQANAQTLARERALRAEIEVMEAQYRQIFDSTSAGIFVLDRDGRLINGNPTVLRMIGGEVGDMRQLRGADFLDRVFARPERVRAMIVDASARDSTASADLELRSADGETRWAHCLVSVQEPRGAGAASPAREAGQGASPDAIVEGVLYDITERKRAEHDVRRRAERDALTGALNRAAIEETIDRFVEQAAPSDAMTLLYLDLDGFKQINDRLGHAAGDAVLQQAVHRIAQELRRTTDVIGRIGGDEFVVVLQHADAGEVLIAQLAERLLARVAESFELEGGERVACGVSIGVSGFPRHGRTRRELMHAADEAMYAVKRYGKNAYASAVGSGA
jgi:diguanylate cyclase (GGDEF)-like protein/PAS domain S-box-containing protein